MKQGAMFGLDARIALAIFGALSVISGAALYSAIQEAKAMRYAQDITEIIKAIESVYLDVGYFPVVEESSRKVYDLRYLYSNPGNIASWRGPYTSGGPVGSLTDYRIRIINGLYTTHMSKSEPADSNCGSIKPATEDSHIIYFYGHYEGSYTCSFDLTLAKNIHDILERDGDYSSGNVVITDKSKSSVIYVLPSILSPYK